MKSHLFIDAKFRGAEKIHPVKYNTEFGGKGS
jgi:hypothetical protein